MNKGTRDPVTTIPAKIAIQGMGFVISSTSSLIFSTKSGVRFSIVLPMMKKVTGMLIAATIIAIAIRVRGSPAGIAPISDGAGSQIIWI